VVRGFGGLTGPTLFALLDGDGSPFADATHLATRASISAELYGPYIVIPGADKLDFYLDGDSSITTTVHLQQSFPATIDAVQREPFDIGAPNGGTPPITNDQFYIDSTGYAQVSVPLSTNATKSIEELCTEINSAITGGSNPPIEAVPYFQPRKYNGIADVEVPPVVGTDADFRAPTGVDWLALGVADSDKLVVLEGLNDTAVYTVDPGTITASLFGATRVSGPAAADEDNVEIELGDPNRLLRMQVKEADRATALAINFAFGFPDVDVAPSTIVRDTLHTIGYVPGIEVISRRTSVEDLVDNFNDSALAAVAGTVRVQAEQEFVATLFSGTGRTEPTTRLSYVLYKLRTTASSIVSTPLPPSITTITVPDTTGAAVGDVVVLREAATIADVGRFATIAAVTATTLVATFAPGPPTDTTDVLIEVGPNLHLTQPNDCVLRISGGSVNDGDYPVTYSGTIDTTQVPFDLVLQRPLTFLTEGGNLPMTATAELGQYRASFSSQDRTLSTEILMQDGADGAFSQFFSDDHAEAAGSTEYYQLPEWPKNLEEGDLLEFYLYENLFSHSEELDHPHWNVDGCTVTADAAAGPFDGTLADELVEDTGNSRHRILHLPGVNVTSTRVTQSVHAKATGRNYLTLGGNIPWGSVAIDLTTGAHVNTFGGWANVVVESVALSGGWWRCAVTRDVTSPGEVAMTIGAMETASTTIYTGNGASALLLYGAQASNTNEAIPYMQTESVGFDHPAGILSPYSSVSIDSLEESSLLIELETEIPTDMPTLPFGTTASYPLGRIRKQKKQNFDDFESAMEDWLELDANEAVWFSNLNAKINPLLVNTNPTPGQVNDAKLHVQQLQAALTQLTSALNVYQVDPVPQLETMVDTFLERGADRAVDILLQARFDEFFGLDTETMSYAGDVMKKIKDVQRQDLPVKKVRRRGAFEETLIASYEEPNFEFDQEDIETGWNEEDVDIPTDFEKIYPGGTY
jgi:hypothetical protein